MPSYEWWQTGVIYQVYPRSFQDSNDDGIGDLHGVIRRLDYLAHTLGVDAVWLSPFYPSPMADFGYDVADYTDVDPIFGSLADFDALVAGAHARGMKVIVDYIPNHTSDRHPWFVESRASRMSPKRDWYVWRDPAPDGGPPNNWLSVFGGRAWTFDEATGQYYLHSFLREQPDLNWRNLEVRRAMFDVARFWLDRGADGLRIDAAQKIMKHPELIDNPRRTEPHGALHKPMGEFDTLHHIHNQAHPDVFDVYRELRQLLDAYDPPRAAFGEIHQYDLAKWVRFYGASLDCLHMPLNFSLLRADWSARGVRAVVDALEAALPEGAWPNWVLGNHDENRLASRYGRAQARVAAMLLLTLRGTPTLYYGDEIGMTDVPVPRERQQDPWGFRSLPELSRDPARTPMQWDGSPSAGFSGAPPDRLWLPLAADAAEVNVARQLDDPTSILSLYRRLLALRRTTPALQTGAYRSLDDVPADCFAYLRETETERVLVILNFSGTEQRVALPENGRIALSTVLDRDDEAVHGTLTLRGHEGVVMRLPASGG